MKKTNYTALIAAGLAAISVFFPWFEVSGSSSYGGYSSSYSSGGVSGIICGGAGVSGLVLALLGGYLALKNNKWTVVPGLINLINGLGYLFGWLSLSGAASYSSNFGGASAKSSVNPQFGLYLFVLASLVFILFTLKYLKENKGAQTEA